MKVMKKTFMAVMAMCAMAFALCVTSVTAEAATKTKKLTLYEGEEQSYYYIGVGTIKSVKTSNKKVVTAKKKGTYSIIKAKKKGSAKVTVKGKYGKFIHKITVKAAPRFEYTVSNIRSGYVGIKVKNTSGMYADNVKTNVIFCDANGNPIYTQMVYFYYVGAKKDVYEDIYLGTTTASSVDLSKTKYETSYTRYPSYTYKDYTSKTTYTVSVSNGYAYVGTRISSAAKSTHYYAAFSVVYKDAAGNVVGYDDSYSYLYTNKKTDTIRFYMPTGAVKAEIISKRAFSEKLK